MPESGQQRQASPGHPVETVNTDQQLLSRTVRQYVAACRWRPKSGASTLHAVDTCQHRLITKCGWLLASRCRLLSDVGFVHGVLGVLLVAQGEVSGPLQLLCPFEASDAPGDTPAEGIAGGSCDPPSLLPAMLTECETRRCEASPLLCVRRVPVVGCCAPAAPTLHRSNSGGTESDNERHVVITHVRLSSGLVCLLAGCLVVKL